MRLRQYYDEMGLTNYFGSEANALVNLESSRRRRVDVTFQVERPVRSDFGYMSKREQPQANCLHLLVNEEYAVEAGFLLPGTAPDCFYIMRHARTS